MGVMSLQLKLVKYTLTFSGHMIRKYFGNKIAGNSIWKMPYSVVSDDASKILLTVFET